MARATIVHKCITIARKAARKDSQSRVTGKSVYIKRCPSGYFIIGVRVTKKQRNCRDMFADAQKLAAYELGRWNRRRHWEREARKHKIKGAHRMAVSYFYGLLKEYGIELDEALRRLRMRRLGKKTEEKGNLKMLGDREWREMDEASPFYYRKFGDVGEYYEMVMRLAG